MVPFAADANRYGGEHGLTGIDGAPAEKELAGSGPSATGSDVAGDASAGGGRGLLVGILITLAGCACWGFNGTLVKFLLDNYPIDPVWLVCVRELGSCWLFLLTAWVTCRDRVVGILREPRQMGLLAVASVACILSSNVCYVESISWTNSATTTVLQSTNLVLVMVYVCLRTRRRPRRREVAGAILALAGTYLLATGGNPDALRIPPQGLAWGMGCAVCAVFLSVAPVGLLNRWGSMVFNGYAMLISGVLLALFVRPWEHVPVMPAAGWVLVAVTIVVGTYGSYALFLEGVRRVGPMRSAMLGTAEPLVAMVSSVVWLGTSFSPADLVGFAMIIAMVFLTA